MRTKDKLLIYSTGKSLETLGGVLDTINEKYDTLAWSQTIEWSLKKSFEPTYFSFLDPHSLMISSRFLSLKESISTTALILDPVLNTDYDAFFYNIGTTNICNDKQRKDKKVRDALFENYVNTLNSIKVKEFRKISSTGCKNQKINIDANPEKRFLGDIVYLGDNALGPKVNRDKLTFACLPIAHWLGYKEIYLVGFDGLKGRFSNPLNNHGVPHFQMSYSANIPLWLSWEQYHKMKIYSCMEHSFLNKWLERKEL